MSKQQHLTIAICGSMAFYAQMQSLATQLEAQGHVTHVPTPDQTPTDWDNDPLTKLLPLKRAFIDEHLEKIRNSDAILIANYAKHGVAGYVGANTLMEAAFAYALGKRIFLLNELGEQGCRLELMAIADDVVGEKALLRSA